MTAKDIPADEYIREERHKMKRFRYWLSRQDREVYPFEMTEDRWRALYQHWLGEEEA